MKSSILTVFKKEMKRIFGDKRLAFTTIFLPGLLIFVMYTVMGTVMSSTMQLPSSSEYNVYAVNLPAVVREAFDSAGIECKDAKESDVDGIKADVKEEKADALVVFPADFETNMGVQGAIPNVKIYYNNESTQSAATFDLLSATLFDFEAAHSNLFDVNAGDETFDFGDPGSVIGKMLSSVMPMLLVIMLFSGALAIAPESIAGEKERGTMAALLVTPAKRSGIALGKVLSISLIALLSGIVTIIGLLASIPTLLGTALQGLGLTLSYTFVDYLMLVLIIVSTELLIVTVLALVSAFAKTVKEANTMSSPIMFLLMGISFFNMFEFNTSWTMFLIPFFNNTQCLGAIFAFDINYVNLLVTIAANLVYTGLGVFALTKMFNSDKIVFGK